MRSKNIYKTVGIAKEMREKLYYFFEEVQMLSRL